MRFRPPFSKVPVTLLQVLEIRLLRVQIETEAESPEMAVTEGNEWHDGTYLIDQGNGRRSRNAERCAQIWLET
jgi:hypothetical protein